MCNILCYIQGIPLKDTLVGRLRRQNSFFILVVWYLFWKTIFCIWKFCREIFGLIYVFMYSEYFKHQTSHYNNIIKKVLLMELKKKRPSDLLYRLLWGPKILREEKKAINLNFHLATFVSCLQYIQILKRRDIYIWIQPWVMSS